MMKGMRARVLGTLLMAGLPASLAPRGGLQVVPDHGATLIDGSPAPVPGIVPSSRRGKGHGKRPCHSSKRFVAQDKRDARKARNRSRA